MVRSQAKDKYRPSQWGIPTGKVNYGESAIAALKREVSEETGLRVLVKRVLAYSKSYTTTTTILF